MSNQDPHLQIARKLQSLETAKVEMVHASAQVLRAIQQGGERDMTEAVGGMVAILYFLANQLGLSFESVDRAATSNIPRSLLQDAADVRDFETVQRYLGPAR